MEEQNNGQQPEVQETAEEKRLRYLTDEERREWSGLSEWHDPLDKPQAEPDKSDSKLAMASLLCGVASVLTACIGVVSVVFGIAAIVFGIFSKKTNETARWMSTAAIILGFSGILITAGALTIKYLVRVNTTEVVNDYIIPGDLADELE